MSNLTDAWEIYSAATTAASKRVLMSVAVVFITFRLPFPVEILRLGYLILVLDLLQVTLKAIISHYYARKMELNELDVWPTHWMMPVAICFYLKIFFVFVLFITALNI